MSMANDVEPSLLLVAEGLSKGFSSKRRLRSREVLAVSDVSLKLSRGETLGIVGESGAGKSTTGRLLLRLIEPDSGSIVFDGQDITELPVGQMRRLRRDMQMIFQDPYSTLDRRLTVAQSISEPLVIHTDLSKADRALRVADLLLKVELGPYLLDRRPGQLSGGQLQRVAIARALATSPKLLVCDESIAALDVSIGAQILNLLIDLRESEGISIIFISHDLRAVRRIAERVVVMKSGAVVEEGPSEQVLEHPTAEYTKELLAALPGKRFPIKDVS